MGKSSEGVSILDGMVAETLATVGAAPKRSLSPLVGERGADNPLPTTTSPFPNDVPTEVVAQKVGELTRIIAHLTESRDALQLLIGLPDEITTERIALHEKEKAKEAAADAKAAKTKREQVNEAMADAAMAVAAVESGAADPEDVAVLAFPERFSALAADAQAATFSKPEVPAPPSGLWHCSVHPDATPLDDRSPKGREFRRCTQPGCKQFER